MSEHWISGVRDPNPKYVLSASIGLTTLRLRFDAPDDEMAARIAMREIFDRSAMEETYEFDQQFWRKGHITLTDPAGAVLRTMLTEGVRP